jgi:tetratricopeptide (TPR) repeat protein
MDIKFQNKIKNAREFEAQGKSLHAIQIYRSLINDFPEIPEPYIYLADIYMASGKKKIAETTIQLIFEKLPGNYEITLYFSQFLMQNENWDKAIELLLKVTGEDPFAEYLIGYCYFKKEEYELAKPHLLKFVKSNEEQELIHEAYFILAKLEFELQQYEDALRHARKAELIFNNDWELYLVFAKIYYKFKMYTHSYDSIKKGIKINGNESVLHKWAGKICIKLDNFSHAKEHFEKYADLKDEITSDDYTYLADACFQYGELNAALNYFESAINLNPENKQALDGREKTINLIKNKAASDM